MCATWSRHRPSPPAEETASPAPRQRRRVLDEHPTSDAEIVREWRNDVTGLALECDMTGVQAGGSLLQRPDGNSVGCHERQIRNREPWEKPCERRRRDPLHAAAVKMKGRAERLGRPAPLAETLAPPGRRPHP